MKRIVCLLLILSMISSFGVVYAEPTPIYSWNNIGIQTGVYVTDNGLCVPFHPEDKYVSMQNPPDFRWNYVNNALSYDLKICTDEALTNVAYEKTGIKNNYYNFSHPFETGKDYYWSVRYKKTLGNSNWSEARRFRIDPDATVFTVPDTSELLNTVPETHPKFFVTADTLEDFRKIKNDNALAYAIYEDVVKEARNIVAIGTIEDEPQITAAYWDSAKDTYVSDKYEEYLDDVAKCSRISEALFNKMYKTAYAYILTGESELGEYAKKALLELCSWDINGATSYAFDDTIHRAVVYYSSVVYDWVYNLLTEEEKATVRAEIVERITYEYKTGNSLGGLLESLKKDSKDSHGWTALGYIGMAAYVFKGEVPEAEEWLETATSLYASFLPPWSEEDGGWSQGAHYWAESTTIGVLFRDILKFGGVVDLYKKAWAKNESIWAMYEYSKGSYGSFGDDSGRNKAEEYSYTADTMLKNAYYSDDPLARWLSKDIGNHSSDSIFNYFLSKGLNGKTRSPEEYAYSHHFTDIDWAIMSNDLIDTDRVQLTFKSSPYGSFNHSHADQNSFYIQAYGEVLAGRSGYYDYYHSPHDKAITRTTSAHNSITIDGGYGQTDERITATGNITQFVNQFEFDSVTGEAAEAYDTSKHTSYAYDGNLERFDRSIIYLRPDVFVVIDDLEASTAAGSSFEWWLNAESSLTVNGNNALISQGEARLSADVLYPQNVTSTYYDEFINPVDGKEYVPAERKGYGPDSPVQKRVSFATQKLPKTKMVVSMSVYKNGESANAAETTYAADGSYMKLAYDDGTTIIVNLQDKENSVMVDGIEFKGTAVTYNDASIMLTNGTYLKKDEVVLVNATENITAAIGRGQLCLSSDYDFNVEIDTNNDYLTVTDISELSDSNGRALSSAIGISAMIKRAVDTNIVVLNAQKGNYTILNGNYGVVVPSQLNAENISIQKSADGKAAVFWDKKNGRSYDIKVDDTVIENVTTMPYVFDVAEDTVQCVYIKEKLGDIMGKWSEPVYVSDYIRESHDKVVFKEEVDGDTTYIKAETLGFPSFNVFDMYLAKFDKDGKLLASQKATADNNIYSAKIEKTADTSFQAFLLGKDLAPLAPVANYGADTTDLLAIYKDGVLIDGFDNSKDEYEIDFEDGRILFPFITAEPKDNTSKVNVEYDFDNLKAIVKVESPSGKEREVVLNFKADKTNVHMVTNSNKTSTEKSYAGTYYDETTGGEVNSKRSTSKLGTVSYMNADNTVAATETHYIYHYMRGNEDGLYNGSRAYVDRYPAKTNANHYEVYYIPEEFKGYDYFVWNTTTYTKAKSTYNGKVNFKFNLAEKADVIILGVTEKEGLEDQGFTKGSTTVKSRYMTNFGGEDKFYNHILLGKDDIWDGGYATTSVSYIYAKNYASMKDWVDVDRIKNYEVHKTSTSTPDGKATYENYNALHEAGTPTFTKDMFTVLGNGTKLINTGDNYTYKYKYTKTFDAGDVSIDFEGLTNSWTVDGMIIIVKPVTPKAFYLK